MRLNPLSIVSNPLLLSLVYGTKNRNKQKISSSSHAMFQTSQDAMILFNDECIIENLNPAVTEIFGFTPEQILGQHIKSLIDTENNSQLFYVINLMLSGQTKLMYETQAIGTKDDSSKIHLQVTLVGFTQNERNASSFAILCKDMTTEIEQKNAVEEAKKKSDEILNQILPKDIIIRLNRGEKNISFTVPCATVMFLDIEKFSKYTSTLTAKEIMQNLSRIFTEFDTILGGEEFNLITKIKLIGDDYMAAAGLFNPDVDKSLHAIQSVNFAIKALEAVENLNIVLNANLQLRVGVNTDGPLIAGVLGVDKPLFDIIGDTINVAARLQSTDIPSLIQVSEGTYNCIANQKFYITQRGEIELKGKGKRMTYLVHPEETRQLRKNEISNV
ncbi:Adenylate and Guanylate cyclase catalytic domain containing protein [Histomonas meleagridis]|uniref:Adenylate and Guanylate cyclase catalytic domain containing protein n=1 Tax=Histomonas meleagridis TaxID=135588 RepID=UPI00355988A3|nr:Adenylate and Guanylate cyclase catalytic domain containing protein [Histomonas meleagridis]KAH0797957.1 Adenylate and Guanylate cyclase catalytic domain containing protein [Histomonas meleagridis]